MSWIVGEFQVTPVLMYGPEGEAIRTDREFLFDWLKLHTLEEDQDYKK